MQKMTLTFTGESPMLMHSDAGANPLDPRVKELRKYTKKRAKTDEDHETIARLEWELGFYFDDKTGPFVPGQNIEATIKEGGKLVKLGTAIKRALLVDQDRVAVKYKGPRKLDDLWAKADYRDVRSVVVGQTRVMRCRPKLPEWAVTFDVSYDPSVLNAEQVIQCAENAGRLIGLGDFRPRFGRFTVEQAQ